MCRQALQSEPDSTSADVASKLLIVIVWETINGEESDGLSADVK